MAVKEEDAVVLFGERGVRDCWLKVRLSGPELEWLMEVARQDDVSMSAFVRRLLAVYKAGMDGALERSLAEGE